MRGQWVNNVRGYVRLKLVGGNGQTFLNQAAAIGMGLWDIRYNREGALTFRVAVPDFFALRPLLKQAGSRTRILERRGFPFQVARLSRRKTFAVGLLAFISALFVLSLLVWDVRIDADDSISQDRVLQAAREEGIRPFQWSFRLADETELAHRIASKLPEAAWVGVKRTGTRMTISVVKSNKPELKPLTGPRDLVAKADAVVTRIVAKNGKPAVVTNKRVRKGEVLISGTLGEGDRTKKVVSEGEVRGLVWHEYLIVSPLKRQELAYTGDSNNRSYLIIGNRALQTSGYNADKFARSEIRSDWHQLQWGKWKLPLGIMKEKELEVTSENDTLTPKQAKDAGLARAREVVLEQAGKDAVVRAEKILHEHADNGKVEIRVLLEVEQSIAVERPILPTSDLQGE